MRQRIEQLEKRQTQDDAVLNVVNRYWNQLNEDIRVVLQRFDAETSDEVENRSMSQTLNNFIETLLWAIIPLKYKCLINGPILHIFLYYRRK